MEKTLKRPDQTFRSVNSRRFHRKYLPFFKCRPARELAGGAGPAALGALRGGSSGNSGSGKSHRQPESGRRLPVKPRSGRQSKATRRLSLGRTGGRGENGVTATELKRGAGGEAGRPL